MSASSATIPAANSGNAGTTATQGASSSSAGTAAPAAGAGAAAPTRNGANPAAAGADGSDTAGTGSSNTAEPATCTRTQANAETPTIYIIGDSTASVYTADQHPRMGWAQPLQDYFAPACAKIEDRALSGRSSKSFYEEGAWSPIQARLSRGDFVLIQFGHNDEKREDASRYTEPFGSYQTFLSKYIDDTVAANATAILLTSIERNNWSNGQLKETHGDYPEAVRALAEKRKLTLVDLTELTHAHFERLGQAATTKLFLNLAPGESPNYPGGNMDNTHLQETGARFVADLALADLARQRAPIASLLVRVPMP